MADFYVPVEVNFADLKSHADFYVEQFREARRSVLSELRLVPGLVKIAHALRPQTLYKLVLPEGKLLQLGKGGFYRGVFYSKGKIQEHAQFAAAVRPGLLNATHVIGSQLVLVNIAIQLNRIQEMVEGLSLEMHRDRIAEVFAGEDQFENAMLMRDPANRRRAILNAVQTLHEGLRKTTAELKDRIAKAPDPANTFSSHLRYMRPPFKSKVDYAKRDMGLAQESFQATLRGIRTLAECYAAIGEGEAARRTLLGYMDRLATCDIQAAAQKARLVEFTGRQPPQAVWEAYLKAEVEIRNRLTALGNQRTGDSVEIEFTRSDVQGEPDGSLS
jgi:hypothetical protein